MHQYDKHEHLCAAERTTPPIKSIFYIFERFHAIQVYISCHMDFEGITLSRPTMYSTDEFWEFKNKQRKSRIHYTN